MPVTVCSLRKGPSGVRLDKPVTILKVSIKSHRFLILSHLRASKSQNCYSYEFPPCILIISVTNRCTCSRQAACFLEKRDRAYTLPRVSSYYGLHRSVNTSDFQQDKVDIDLHTSPPAFWADMKQWSAQLDSDMMTIPISFTLPKGICSETLYGHVAMRLWMPGETNALCAH